VWEVLDCSLATHSLPTGWSDHVGDQVDESLIHDWNRCRRLLSMDRNVALACWPCSWTFLGWNGGTRPCGFFLGYTQELGLRCVVRLKNEISDGVSADHRIALELGTRHGFRAELLTTATAIGFLPVGCLRHDVPVRAG